MTTLAENITIPKMVRRGDSNIVAGSHIPEHEAIAQSLKRQSFFQVDVAYAVEVVQDYLPAGWIAQADVWHQHGQNLTGRDPLRVGSVKVRAGDRSYGLYVYRR